MTETWRPLGVDSDDEVAEYDALHDGIPTWMRDAYWHWVKMTVTEYRSTGARTGGRMMRVQVAEEMCQTLQIRLPDLRKNYISDSTGKEQWSTLLGVLLKHPRPLQVADYLLGFDSSAQAMDLQPVLDRAKSVWTIGTRAGRPGLVRRVPLGVQVAADSIMGRADRAGVRLAKAWEELYGLAPNPSEAYRLAIQSVEDAAIPVVSPTNTSATLGTVIKQIEDQKNWKLPMDREHANAPTGAVLVGMMRMLWHGQHDRHGGQPSAPGNVSQAEARVAVSIAVTLVDWFSAGLPKRF